MRHLRRIPAVVFAGDRRVWRVALVVGVPLLALVAYYCLRPLPYYTGTNSVELYTYVAETPAGEPLCVPDLEIPAETARIQLQLISRTTVRPAMSMSLTLQGPSSRVIHTSLKPTDVAASHISVADFPVPTFASRPAETHARLCVTAKDLVNWGGTPLPTAPAQPPTAGGHPLAGRVAIWYLPSAGRHLSYLARLGRILKRASLFRPDGVGPWLYYLILTGVLPGLGLLAVRCLAVASAAGRTLRARRMGATLYVIAAVNFACWALITPPFQAPDEVDHFAYTQSLVERGEAPSRNLGSPLPRWSASEALLLEDMSVLTDHQIGNTRAPWSRAEQDVYRQQMRTLRPSSSDGGGTETAATHGVVYYAALAPAYLLASSSPLDQLTLMRLASALIGALAVLFAFLLARELAPGRPWVAVLAALLIAFEPMYGFISGTVNNDVGVNAGAAAFELVLLMIIRRGFSWRLCLLAGGLLATIPLVKGTFDSLFPVAAIAVLLALWRHHRRRDALGLAGLAGALFAIGALATHFDGLFRKVEAGGSGNGAGATAAGGTIEAVLQHPLGYLAYLWEVFLPRLSFMAPHFETAGPPFFLIYVERGWGAFGWYVVFYSHWVYDVIFGSIILVVVLALAAAWRERAFLRRNLPETAILLLSPIAVVAGVEAAFYTIGVRGVVGEFGRYAFPAIAPLAVLVAASLHAFGRRWAPMAGAVLLVAMLALSFAGQLVTLTGFYA